MLRVEFFGMARRRAQVEAVELRAESLSEVIAELTRLFPSLAASCFRDAQLAPGWTFNIDGQRFTRDPEEVLVAGCCLLLMSSDVGG